MLRGAIGSSDATVRSAVAGALAQAGDERSVEALLQLSRDTDPGVRQQALAGLGQTGSARAVDALVSATGASEQATRLAAVASLGSVDDPRAGRELARLMQDPDEQVASAAVWAASQGGEDVERALWRVFETASPGVRVAAAQQLRARGADGDDRRRAAIDELLGGDHGYGYGYGGHGYGGHYIDEW